MPHPADILRPALFALLLAHFCCADETANQQRDAIRAALAKVAPSVIMLETVGGRDRVEDVIIPRVPVPGVIVDARGYIVTSSFHLVHDPTAILVTTPGGKRVPAKVLGRDRSRLLALLKIETEETLVVPETIPPDQIRVGQTALAVGAGENGEPILSRGIVSALGRVYGKAFQFDARVQMRHYGGPVVDWQGRVLGITTPLNPMSAGELAGVEWYDSGIGFAVPLQPWLSHVELLSQGKNLLPGILGVSLRAGDPYVLPAEVIACQQNSPAYKAGLRKGDRITSCDGQPIERQMQLRHALGPHYAGDRIHVTAQRGDVKIDAEVTLAEKLAVYRYPALGMLPRRHAAQSGIVLRDVWPDGPAAKAGMRPGDRLVKLGDAEIKSTADLRQLLADVDPDKPLRITLDRTGQELTLEVKPDPLTGDALAAATLKPERLESGEPSTVRKGLWSAKLAEVKNDCFVYVPEDHRAGEQLGLLVWLGPPGPYDQNEFRKQLAGLADEFGWIVISPRPAEAGKWQPDEARIVRKFIDQAIGDLPVDRARVAIAGREASGLMAWFVALSGRDLLRGVATLDAPLSERAELVNDPVERLYVFLARSEKELQPELATRGEPRLREAGVPLYLHQKTGRGDFSDDERRLLFRWLDLLDRL